MCHRKISPQPRIESVTPELQISIEVIGRMQRVQSLARVHGRVCLPDWPRSMPVTTTDGV